MSTNSIKPNRIQIGFSPTTAMFQRLQSLGQKLLGLSDTEIIKLAIITLDNQLEQVETETDYIKKDPTLYNRLLKYKTEPLIGGKFFENLKDFE